MDAAATAGGFIVNRLVLDRLPFAFAQSGWGRIAAKAAAAALGGMLIGRFAGKSIGRSYALGGMTDAALDVAGMVLNRGPAAAVTPARALAGFGPAYDNGYRYGGQLGEMPGDVTYDEFGNEYVVVD